MLRASRRNPPQWLISVLLVTLIVRALIPAGFMPASDRPFSFQICPDGFPAHLLKPSQSAPAWGDSSDGGSSEGSGSVDHAAHHHHAADGARADAQGPATHAPPDGGAPHQHSSASSEHCVFAAAVGAGPLAFVPTFSAQAVSLRTPLLFNVSPTAESQRFRIQQPRGPPALS